MTKPQSEMKRISGKGVDGLEDCPPAYHVEFDGDTFAEFIANPVEVLAKLGVKFDSVSITLSDKRWFTQEEEVC